jgi:hypothetical protein
MKLPARRASASNSVPVKELVKSSGGLVSVQFLDWLKWLTTRSSMSFSSTSGLSVQLEQVLGLSVGSSGMSTCDRLPCLLGNRRFRHFWKIRCCFSARLILRMILALSVSPLLSLVAMSCSRCSRRCCLVQVSSLIIALNSLVCFSNVLLHSSKLGGSSNPALSSLPLIFSRVSVWSYWLVC